MQKLQKHSIARISLLLSKLSWYFFLIIGALAPVVFLLAYMDKLPETLNATMSIPVNGKALSLATELNYPEISIDSATLDIEMVSLAQEFPSLFLGFSLFSLIGLIILLTILYHLKNLLSATVNEAVFTQLNIKRIKTIAILLISIDPLRWIFFVFLSQSIYSDVLSDFTISISSTGYWVVGLLIYTLAAVFEKGHEMYQELKLTV